MVRSDYNLLGQRVNTFLGSLLLVSVSLWAGTTIWEVAHGQNPIATVLASMLEQEIDY